MARLNYAKEIKQTLPKAMQLIKNLRLYGLSRSQINEAVRAACESAEKMM